MYLLAWQVKGKPLYRRIVEETLDDVAREMRESLGGFPAAQDADSEGEEGRFSVWTPAQIEEMKGDATLVKTAFEVAERGNFEGKNILHVVKEADEVARALDPDDSLAIAEATARFVLSQLREPEGRLLRTWKGGEAKLNGYLEDDALYAEGLIEPYQTTFDPVWFDAALELAVLITDRFADPASGFFDTSDDHEQLLFRPKETQDGAKPSGGSVAAIVLAKLGALPGSADHSEVAEAAMGAMRAEMSRAPLGYASWLTALDFVLSEPRELAIVGADALPMLRVVRSTYRPNLVVAVKAEKTSSSVPLLVDRDAVDGTSLATIPT